MDTLCPLHSAWHGLCSASLNKDGHEHMKTAFSSWNHRIAPVFDVARQLLLVESHEEGIISEAEATMPADDPGEKAECLARLGVNTLVCGAISRPMQGLIESRGIALIPFVAGDLREVIQAWMEGRIHEGAFTMPGCCSRSRQRGRWSGRGPCQTRYYTGICGFCVCPQCSHREPHVRGIPCSRKQCPVCGSPLVRGNIGIGEKRI